MRAVRAALYLVWLRSAQWLGRVQALARGTDLLVRVIHYEILPETRDHVAALSRAHLALIWNMIRAARRLVAPHTFVMTGERRCVLAHARLVRRPGTAPLLRGRFESCVADRIREYLVTGACVQRLVAAFLNTQATLFHLFQRQCLRVDDLCYYDAGAANDLFLRMAAVPRTPCGWDWRSVRRPVLLDTAYVGQFRHAPRDHHVSLLGWLYPQPGQRRDDCWVPADAFCETDLLPHRRVPSPGTTDYHPATLLHRAVLDQLEAAFRARRALRRFVDRRRHGIGEGG
ncbi:MAG: hypothetical protein AAFS07_18970 [Pseudomonadota bacterium]